MAVLIADRIKKLDLPRKKGQEAHVAYLQGLVAARLFFREVLRVIVPMTQWWRDRKVQDGLQAYTPEKLSPRIKAIIKWAQANDEDTQAKLAEAFADFTALDRYVALAGIILWAGMQDGKATASGGGIGDLMAKIEGPDAIVEELQQLFEEILRDSFPEEAQIWQVSLNRKAMPALERSVPAVKADAARTLFKVKCDEIRWAVLDSGIDGTHPSVQGQTGRQLASSRPSTSAISERSSVSTIWIRRRRRSSKGSANCGRVESKISAEKEATDILKSIGGGRRQ